MNDKTRYEIMKNRELLKGYHAADAGAEETDQQQKLPSIPCLQEKRETDTIPLPTDYASLSFSGNIMELISGRESRRTYADAPLSLLELSFLLWSTQGVRRFAGHKNPVTFRNVPSAGSRHSFETFLFVHQVEGLKKGIYHYLPQEHELEFWDKNPSAAAPAPSAPTIRTGWTIFWDFRPAPPRTGTISARSTPLRWGEKPDSFIGLMSGQFLFVHI